MEMDGELPSSVRTGRLTHLTTDEAGFLIDDGCEEFRLFVLAGPVELWLWRPPQEKGQVPDDQHMRATLRDAANMLRELRCERVPAHGHARINDMIDRCNAAALGVGQRQTLPEQAEQITKAIAYVARYTGWSLAHLQRLAPIELELLVDAVSAVIQAENAAGGSGRPTTDVFDALDRIAAASRYQLDVTRWAKPGSAKALADRVTGQFEGFRLLAERAATARAEILACESLIARAFERLAEVDPEFVEDLRRGSS